MLVKDKECVSLTSELFLRKKKKKTAELQTRCSPFTKTYLDRDNIFGTNNGLWVSNFLCFIDCLY